MAGHASCCSGESAECTAKLSVDTTMNSMWEAEARRGLESSDLRLRLQAYSCLSVTCSRSKQMQQRVGKLLQGDGGGGDSNTTFDTSPLHSVFRDLQSTDRTLRIAAARVLCLSTYENLANQQIIMRWQSTQSLDGGESDDDEGNSELKSVGVTVGWLHVFSTPQTLRDRYVKQCGHQEEDPTRLGFKAFISREVADNYASAYSDVSRYYAGGCCAFLPLCWAYPSDNRASDMTHVSDPSDHLLGFYLIPRQTQFPEQDDAYLELMLRSMQTEEELARLQQVHVLFQSLAAQTRDKEVSATTLRSAIASYLQLGWLCTTPGAVTNNSTPSADRTKDCSGLRWLLGDPRRVVSWKEVLVWCCARLNAEEMHRRAGAEVHSTILALFQTLALDDTDPQRHTDLTKLCVWEPVLVGIILNHSTLPDEFKEQIRRFLRSDDYPVGVHKRGRRRSLVATTATPEDRALPNSVQPPTRPWEYLLALELPQISPLSWGVFLSKWRLSADARDTAEDDVQVFHSRMTRHHSIPDSVESFVSNTRKNALAAGGSSLRIFHSFRDLAQLRHQLPLIASRTEAVISKSLEPPESPTQKDQKAVLTEQQKRVLAEKRALFRRLQKSPIELDELTRKQLEDKRATRSKTLQDAAAKRKKADALAEKWRRAWAVKQTEKQTRLQQLAQRRELEWQASSKAKQERHHRAVTRKQQVRASHAAWKQHLQEKMQQRDDRLQQHQGREEQLRPTSPSPRHQPNRQLTPRQPLAPRRPLSARTPAPVSPEIRHERAKLYGCAVSSVHVARRPQTARDTVLSTTEKDRKPRSSRTSDNGLSAGDEGNEINAVSTMSERSNEWVTVGQQLSGAGNACATRVMTKAAQEVAQQITIPRVAAPVPEDARVPPAVIMAQYTALGREQQLKLHERYGVNRVSHQLTFAVLHQLTHELRQDAAWREFQVAAAGSGTAATAKGSSKSKSKSEAKVTYAAFAAVAERLGISMAPKKMQAAARSLDPRKTGFVGWEGFYTWWSSHTSPSPHI